MSELLTRAQVANLTGYTTRWIPYWAADRGVPAVVVGDRTYYRAGDVDRVLRSRCVPGPLRLARFIRNPLNHTALDKPTTSEETPDA